jgi:thiamine-phosphate pyrophosphorylase
LETIRQALKGGVDIVQLRDYQTLDGRLLQIATSLRQVTLAYGALFIVNNRPDIALLSEADGAHVGQGDLPVRLARKILGGNKIVGLSTHSAEQARGAVVQGADYIGVGPVFDTPTKQGRPGVGLGLVTDVAQLNLSLPAFAIGGIDLKNLANVKKAGAKGVSVVRALVDADDPEAAAREMKEALK